MSDTNLQPKKARVDITVTEFGVSKIAATVRWENGTVTIDGEPDMVQEISGGVSVPPMDHIVKPEDGYAFLAALPTIYDTPYVLATETVEE